MALVSTTGATIKDVEPCVALRTGAQYLDSIAKDRQIFIHGQKISRCRDDAELAKSTRLRADIYDLLSHPEQIGVTGRYDVALGAVVSRLHSAPVSKQCWHDKLSILDMMFQKLAYLPCRVGDETIPAVWSMMDGLEIIAEKNAGFAANVVRHYHHILTHDPYHVSGNADPKTDRSAAAQASGKSNLLRSVGETSEGIVVLGAKYETGAAYSASFSPRPGDAAKSPKPFRVCQFSQDEGSTFRLPQPGDSLCPPEGLCGLCPMGSRAFRGTG